MEDALSVYVRPHDENRPVACMDEKPCQLLSHAREPLPMESGKLARGGTPVPNQNRPGASHPTAA